MYPCADFCVAPIWSRTLMFGPGPSVVLLTYGFSEPGFGRCAPPIAKENPVAFRLFGCCPIAGDCSYVPGPDAGPLSSSLPSRDHDAGVPR